MAIRIYINKEGWLGTNNLPVEIFDELKRQVKRQGAGIYEDDLYVCCEIKDLNGLVLATEGYIRNLYNKRKEINWNIADFSGVIENKIKDGQLTNIMMKKQECADIFLSCNLLNIIGANNYDTEYDYEDGKLIVRYNLKPDVKIILECYKGE